MSCNTWTIWKAQLPNSCSIWYKQMRASPLTIRASLITKTASKTISRALVLIVQAWDRSRRMSRDLTAEFQIMKSAWWICLAARSPMTTLRRMQTSSLFQLIKNTLCTIGPWRQARLWTVLPTSALTMIMRTPEAWDSNSINKLMAKRNDGLPWPANLTVVQRMKAMIWLCFIGQRSKKTLSILWESTLSVSLRQFSQIAHNLDTRPTVPTMK